MQQNTGLAVRVGIFFTIAIILVLGLSLQTGKGRFFSDTYDIVANFRQTHGIDPGTKVTLRGVPVGTVRSMDWNAKIYRVAVILEIKDKYQIPRNAVAKIQVGSLLGGNVVNIAVEEGPEEPDFLALGDSIQTEETPSIDEVLATVSTLSKKTETLISGLDENQKATLGKINAVIDENREYIKATSKAFSEAGPKLSALSDRLNEMTEFMKGGQGTIGALYADKSLYDQLKGFSDSMNEVAQQVKSGKGTLGSLIYGDDFAKEAKQIMTDLQRAAREIEAAVGENREGFRNLVSALSNASPRIEAAINNFTDIGQKINKGDGTLGKLVNDPSLYNDAQRAVNQVGESFESGEEQGVFRSFLGLVFGALI